MTETATQQDVSRLVQSLKLRDERIVFVETELRRVGDDYRRLREELLPVFKMTKDRLQPLPPPDGHGGSYDSHHTLASPSRGISRAFSKRIYTGGSTPKTGSPTFHDGRGGMYSDNSNSGSLDPSSASGPSQQSPGVMPSPTSPGHQQQQQQQTLGSRAYSSSSPSSSSNNRHDHADDLHSSSHSSSRADRDRSTPSQATPQQPLPSSTSSSSRADTPSRAESRSGGDSQPSVEIFKSFRVSLEDPCYKVLPAALKKYNINGDWRQYALYIVYGDQERCLMLDERPLILFKQLEKEGRKPMFMLRKQTYPVDSSYANAAAASSSGMLDGIRQGQINLPGGVL